MRSKKPLTGLLAVTLLLGLSACAQPVDAPSGEEKQPTVEAPAAQAGEQENEVAPMDAENKIWNIKDFGAMGNGQTDDYAAVQKAVNTVMRAGGGTVYFPEGNYRMTQTLRITMAGEAPLTLLADPAASVGLSATAEVEGPAVYVNHPYVTINNVTISRAGTTEQPALVLASDYAQLIGMSAYTAYGNHQPGILVYGSYNTIKHCGVGYNSTMEHMIVFTKKPGTACYGNVLEDCHFGGQHGKCVLVTSDDENGAPENLTIRRNVFLVVACDQVEVRAGRDIYIVDNMLDAAGVCVLLDPLAVGIDGLQMTDNYCGASTGGDRTGGLRTQTTYGGSVKRVVVADNYFWSPWCISLASDQFTQFTITDNYMVLTGGNALYMKTAAGAYIEGNVVANVSATAPVNIEAVDGDTVIQYNGFGSGVVCPEWADRFAPLN